MFKNFKSIPRDVKFAIFGLALAWLFWGPADTYFSLFLKSFGADYSQIGILLAIKKVLPLFLAIPIGFISDRFSSRKLVITSLWFYILLGFAYYFSGFYNSLILVSAAIMLDGFSEMLRNISFDTYIKRKTPKRLSVRTWAYYQGIIHSGYGIGVILSGFLVILFAFHELFLLTIIGVSIKLYLFYKLSEDVKKKRSKIKVHSIKSEFHKHLKHLFRIDKRVGFLLIAMFLSGLVTLNSRIFLVLLADELNFSLIGIALLFGLLQVSSLFAIPLTRLVNKIGNFTSMTLGQVIMALALLGVFLVSRNSVVLAFVFFFMGSSAFQLVKPTRNGIIGALTPKSMQGEITGIQRFVLASANLIGVLVMGFLSKDFGIEYAFLFTAVIHSVTAICFLILKFKFEHTVKHVKIHPHGSILSKFHIDLFHHSPPREIDDALDNAK